MRFALPAIGLAFLGLSAAAFGEKHDRRMKSNMVKLVLVAFVKGAGSSRTMAELPAALELLLTSAE